MAKLKSKFQINTQKYTLPKKWEKYIRVFTDEDIKEWLEEDKLDKSPKHLNIVTSRKQIQLKSVF